MYTGIRELMTNLNWQQNNVSQKEREVDLNDILLVKRELMFEGIEMLGVRRSVDEPHGIPDLGRLLLPRNLPTTGRNSMTRHHRQKPEPFEANG